MFAGAAIRTAVRGGDTREHLAPARFRERKKARKRKDSTHHSHAFPGWLPLISFYFQIVIMRERITVVVPFFNRSRFLARLLESVRRQTLLPDVVLVIDNGSCLEECISCAKIIEDYRGHFTSIEFLSTVKKGNANYARELGLNIAPSGYVAFLDSDDWWESEHLSTALQTLQRSGRTAYYCGANIYGSLVESRTTSDVNKAASPFKFLLTKNNIAQTSSYVIRKDEIHNNMRLWDQKLKRHQDYDFFLTVFFQTSGWCTSKLPLTNIDWDEGGAGKKIDFRSMVRFTLKWQDKVDKETMIVFLSTSLKELYSREANTIYTKYYIKKILELSENKLHARIKYIAQPMLISIIKINLDRIGLTRQAYKVKNLFK